MTTYNLSSGITGEKNMKYKVYSEMTKNTPLFESNSKKEAMDFCYSQNKNIYPKSIMPLMPMYCFIREELI